MDAKARLVSATADLLWERGYGATSPKDIQRRARVGQGSMYHHFTGKQELAVIALQDSATAMKVEAEELLSGHGAAVDRLIAYLVRQRDSLRGCRMGRMTYDADVLATPALLAPVANTLEWLVDTLAGVVDQGVLAGEFPTGTDSHELASMVVATVQGGYVLARARQDQAAFDAAVDGAVALLRARSQS